MWKTISLTNAVWFIDATSNIHRKIKDQKRVFLYSIVAHDVFKKNYVNVADFITTRHTSINLTKYFLDIFYLIQASNAILAPIIVIDFSWALLISLMKAINNCDLIAYLDWSYDMLVLKKTNDVNKRDNMKSKIVLCSVHFFKNVVRKTKALMIKSKNSYINSKIKKIFLFSFTLLLNSVNIDEFLKHYRAIYYLFGSTKWNGSVIYSYQTLKDDCKIKKLHETDITGYTTREELDNLEEKSEIYENEEIEQKTYVYQSFTQGNLILLILSITIVIQMLHFLLIFLT